MANDKDFLLKNAVEVGGPTKVTLGSIAAGSTVGYSLPNASYDSVNFSVAGQDTSPRDVTFNNDGTKMYMVGATNDSVYQYSLSTAYDMSTASYDSVSFSVSGQDDFPNGVAFSNDGTKMYIVGDEDPSESVYQYSLSTAFDLSTASYDSVSFSITSQDQNPRDLTFNSDGTKMYIMGNDTDSVYQYSLSTAFDLSTASYDSVSFSVSGQDTTVVSIAFNNDGSKMYIVGTVTDSVYQYTLSTAFDLSTASYDSVSFSVSSEDSNPIGITFNDDGTKMYVVGFANDTIYQYSTSLTPQEVDLATGNYFADTLAANTTYTISNAGDVQSFQLEVTGGVGDTYDFSSVGAEVGTFDLSADARDTGGIYVKPDGTKFYIAAFRNPANSRVSLVHEYNMTTAWDITTAAFVNSFSVDAQETYLSGVTFSPSGTKMLIVGFGADAVHEYTLSTAWDITTASFDRSLSTTSYETAPRGLQFNNDGSKLYVVGTGTNRLVEYTLPNAYSLLSASYSTDVDSTATEAIMFSSDGTRVFLADADTSLREYTLSTAFDISSVVGASPDNTYTLAANTAGMHDGGVGENLYLANVGGDSVTQVKIYADATLTWPSSIEWAGGIAPSAPATGETDVFTFVTDDGGTSYVGVKTADNLS